VIDQAKKQKQIHCGRDLSHIQRPKLRVGFLLEYNFEILVQILNQTKLTSIVFVSAMEVNGDQQLFGYQYSSKYCPFCSTELRKS